MGSFASKATIDIADEATGRVITIRAELNQGQMGAFQSEVLKQKIGGDAEVNIANAQLALFKHFVVAWRGGDLEGVPCNPDMFKELSASDPFLERVAQRIVKIVNGPHEGFDPNAPTTNGAVPSTANESVAPLVNGTSS
jgi:hypothetical protein